MSVTYVRRPEGLGEPLGRYSHISIGSGRAIHVAGQVGVVSSGELAGDGSFDAQVRQAFANVVTALRAGGASPQDVAKTTTFLVGVEQAQLDEFMHVRGEIFGDLFPDGNFPPNTLLFVPRLVETRLLVEIEAVAFVAGSND